MNLIKRLPARTRRAVVRNPDLIVSFLLPAVILLGIMAYRGIYPFGILLGRQRGSYTVLTSDLNNQYAQFYAYFDQAIKGHGSLFFTWRADLGMNFWPIVAYYLASPFGLITLLGGDQRLPIMLAVVMVLKVGTAGWCMQLLLRKFRDDRPRAVGVLFATGYALMAWSLVYAFNIMWLDALFLLPLVLLGIERLLAKGRIAPLAVALAANFIIDFYTGAMIAVFAVLYFCARYFGVREAFSRNDFVRTGARFALSGLIGGAISAFFTLPTYIGGIKERSPLSVTASVRPGSVNPLEMLIRFFGGTVDTGFRTPDVAAGTLLLLLVPLFFTIRSIRKAEKIAFGVVLGILLLATVWRPLYLVMHGGEMPNAFPYRFAFLITATMVLMAYRAWAGVDSVRQVRLLVTTGVVWFVVLYIGRKEYPRILTGQVTDFNAVVLVFGTAALAWSLWLRVRPADAPRPARFRSLPGWMFTPRTGVVLAVVALGVDVSGSAVLVGQKKMGISGTSTKYNSWYRSPSTSYGQALQDLQPASDQFFRAEGYDRTLRSYNDSLRYGNFGQTHFSSLASGKLHATLSDLGFTHHAADVWASHTGATLLTDALLGYQYLVTTTSRADGTAGLDRADVQLVKTYGTPAPTWSDAQRYSDVPVPDATKVWQIEDTLPVGFRLDAAQLAGMTQTLPQTDPFAAQEQAFQMPGAFQSMCTGTPTVTGTGMSVQQTGDSLTVSASPQATSASLTWQCDSPGDRQLYIYAPTALAGANTYVRVDAPGRPAPKTGPDPYTCKFGPSSPSGQTNCTAYPTFSDPANKNYPYAYSNGIQDLGTVPAGPFTVTIVAPQVDAGQTYPGISLDPIRGLDPAAVSAKLAELRAGGVTGVTWSDTGLSATTTGTDASTVFFSIPSIPGWNVTVDGKSVPTTQLLGSFVGVPVAAGTHRIAFSYTPPGLYAGAGGTVVGLIALGGVWMYQRRRPAVRSDGAGDGPAAAEGPEPNEPIHEEARA